jgi:predicted SAM-dependent methyltransferase
LGDRGEGRQVLRNFLLFFFSHRFLAIARWDFYFLRLRLLNVITLQRRRIRKGLSTRQRPLFLNLGSGPRGVDDPHWVNVDGFRDRNVHFLFDLSRPLPFPDESFDGVFCEHVLEHFSRESGEMLAQEICRVLRKGGCLRIAVPDAQLVLRRYFDAPADLVARRGNAGNEEPMEIVNMYFRQRYEHQFLYDWTTLETTLSRAGFGQILRVSFGEGRLCPRLTLDDQKYEWESLYAEASKFNPS